jgi:hypothetical protein
MHVSSVWAAGRRAPSSPPPAPTTGSTTAVESAAPRIESIVTVHHDSREGGPPPWDFCRASAEGYFEQVQCTQPWLSVVHGPELLPMHSG